MTVYNFTYGGYGDNRYNRKYGSAVHDGYRSSGSAVLEFPHGNTVKRHIHRKMKNRFLIGALIIFCALCLTLICVTLTARKTNAGSYDPYGKAYESYTVEEGDTLWSLAKSHQSAAYSDPRTYVSEVKSINHLIGDTIHTGMNLVLPYYPGK